MKHIICCIFLMVFFIGCFGKSPAAVNNNSGSRTLNQDNLSFQSSAGSEESGSNELTEELKADFIGDFWSGTFDRAGLPDYLRDKIFSYLMQGPDFAMELFSLMDDDPYLIMLVDKQHALEEEYIPDDLIELGGGSYQVTRSGLMLRREAAVSLQAMAAAARSDGIVLTAASAFRSFEYQAEVYSRNVRELGQQAADRESARPGHSQHQLGLVLDFYPIDDAFANTASSLWLKNNAARFGWSLSFPEDYEEITGYRWESWHYRYMGVKLVNFIDKYFDGIQQYALLFIHTCKNSTTANILNKTN